MASHGGPLLVSGSLSRLPTAQPQGTAFREALERLAAAHEGELGVAQAVAAEVAAVARRKEQELFKEIERLNAEVFRLRRRGDSAAKRRSTSPSGDASPGTADDPWLGRSPPVPYLPEVLSDNVVVETIGGAPPPGRPRHPISDGSAAAQAPYDMLVLEGARGPAPRGRREAWTPPQSPNAEPRSRASLTVPTTGQLASGMNQKVSSMAEMGMNLGGSITTVGDSIRKTANVGSIIAVGDSIRKKTNGSIATAGKPVMKKADTQAMFSVGTEIVEGERKRQQHRKRFRRLFGPVESLDAAEIVRVLEAEKLTPKKYLFDKMLIQDALVELNKVWQRDARHWKADADGTRIEVVDLVDLFLRPDLESQVNPALVDAVMDLRGALLLQKIEDIIRDITRDQVDTYEEVTFNELADDTPFSLRLEGYIVRLASVAVAASIFIMGASLDYWPGSGMWTTLEALCGLAFLAEVLIKMYNRGVKEYFTNKEWRYWHILDVVITAMSLLDVVITLLSAALKFDVSGGFAGQARITVAMRLLRVARVARLMKFLHSPLLRDFANMLAGFLIGIPALMWVMVLLFVVVYIMALVFRQALGPNKEDPDTWLTPTCGKAEDVLVRAASLPTFPPVCTEKLHWVYGEAYFGSVPQAMFTIFRCMIGDCTTEPGGSLAVILSDGYGMRFYIIYCVGMIIIMFGLFNIITAIFVDSTISGLKHNDTKRKYAKQYESTFVQKKLKVLLDRVQFIVSRGTGLADAADGEEESYETINMNKEQFKAIMKDEKVRAVMSDLDVEVYNAAGFFDTFDPNGDNLVTTSELVDGILKLRGEPQKKDLIAAQVALQAISTKVDLLTQMLHDHVKQGGPASSAMSPRRSLSPRYLADA